MSTNGCTAALIRMWSSALISSALTNAGVSIARRLPSASAHTAPGLRFAAASKGTISTSSPMPCCCLNARYAWSSTRNSFIESSGIRFLRL